MRLWFGAVVLALAVIAPLNAKAYDEPSSAHRVQKRGTDIVDVPFNSGYPYQEHPNHTNETKLLLGAMPRAGGIFDPFEIDLEGEYFWERLYYIDNRNQSNPYRETRKITKTISTSITELTKSAFDASIKIGRSVEAGAKLEVISATVKNSLDIELSKSYQTTVEKKTETTITEELTREFTVGANSVGEMFRLVYRGPGVTFATGTVSTNGSIPLDKVIISCRVRQVAMIKEIQVVYTNERVEMPTNVITETRGGSPDINKEKSGKYVWLVPVWTSKKDEAVSNIHVVIQSERNDNYEDLAAGAGGDYRYLKMLHNPHATTRVGRVGLLRSPKSTYIFDNRKDYGWDECTGDINEDRKGDWLHLCWNTVSVH